MTQTAEQQRDAALVALERLVAHWYQPPGRDQITIDDPREEQAGVEAVELLADHGRVRIVEADRDILRAEWIREELGDAA